MGVFNTKISLQTEHSIQDLAKAKFDITAHPTTDTQLGQTQVLRMDLGVSYSVRRGSPMFDCGFLGLLQIKPQTKLSPNAQEYP